MVTTNKTKSAATAAAQAATAEDVLGQLEGADQPTATATTTIPNGRNGNSVRAQRFGNPDIQRAYYKALDEGMSELIARLSSEYGQQELSVIDDINDRLVEKLFVIKCKLVKAVAAGKAGTGEQLSDGFRTAFADVMKRICGRLFPDSDSDVMLKMKGLPGVNGARFSRMMIQQLANRVAEEYAGSEIASEGYQLLDQARDARNQ